MADPAKWTPGERIGGAAVSSFRVMVVCTANHCRSPIAQQLLAHDAMVKFAGPDETAPAAWQVTSSGTDVPGPWPMHEYAVTALAQRLPRVAAHHSTPLQPAAIADADLILTAERRHRGIVVSMLPKAVGRTFTILQFARLCDEVAPITSSDPGELGRQLVVEAKLARSSLQPVHGDEDDLPDPMGRGLADFTACADRLQDEVDRILRPLTLLR